MPYAHNPSLAPLDICNAPKPRLHQGFSLESQKIYTGLHQAFVDKLLTSIQVWEVTSVAFYEQRTCRCWHVDINKCAAYRRLYEPEMHLLCTCRALYKDSRPSSNFYMVLAHVFQCTWAPTLRMQLHWTYTIALLTLSCKVVLHGTWYGFLREIASQAEKISLLVKMWRQLRWEGGKVSYHSAMYCK